MSERQIYPSKIMRRNLPRSNQLLLLMKRLTTFAGILWLCAHLTILGVQLEISGLHVYTLEYP